MRFVSGLDIGQSADYTAMVVLDVTYRPMMHVREIRRWQLGTSYPSIIADLVNLYGSTPLGGSTLVVDETGVGRPIVDYLRQSNINAHIIPYTITCGLKPGDGTVPKKDLVGAVKAASGRERLKVADGLPLGPVLWKELQTFSAKVTSDRNETFASWREKDKDDIVLALALSVYYATLHDSDGSEVLAANAANARRTPFDSLPPGVFDGRSRTGW
jgi:hypothetical protein